ncbi:MAG TPA: hypothetical protein VG106_09680 [Vicinamibacterales bacterium]|nr:hypothetical protein [Vicinamibacterales bacterium]
MKRLLIVFMLLLVPAAAFAFDAKKRPTRVAVLRVAPEYIRGGEDLPAYAIVRTLEEELRKRGIEAFDAKVSYHDFHQAPPADYYVEIMGASLEGRSYGGVGLGTRAVGVSFEMIATGVATEVRIYDGGTRAPLASEVLERRKKGVMPTSLALGGGRAIWAALIVPVAEWAQYRSAVMGVARDAAKVVVDVLHDR